MEEKRVRDSYSEQVQILTQANINGYHRLFGGQLDGVDRHCRSGGRQTAFRKNVTTAVVDTLTFQRRHTPMIPSSSAVISPMCAVPPWKCALRPMWKI